MRSSWRFGVLCLTVAVVLVVSWGGQAVAQTDVCLSAQVDYFLKISDIPGESRAVSVQERCGDGSATIAVTVSPAAPRRPAETIIVIVGQCPTCDPPTSGPQP